MQITQIPRSRVIIALALQKAFISTKMIPLDQLDQIDAVMHEENAVMQKKYGEKHWKAPLTATFLNTEIPHAELFASAILNNHGVDPTITFYPGRVEVSTPGYSC
jgi:hypothetical protein